MKNPVNRLIEMIRTLRAENGSDWDKKQTLSSLKKYLLEECYELLDAIESLEHEDSQSNITHHREELGDLLLQIIFQSHIQSEKNHFDFYDVAQTIVDKLQRRLPQFFASNQHSTADTNTSHWDTVKAQEKAKQNLGVFDGIAKNQPALLRACKIGEAASRYGFDWQNVLESTKKIHEESAELCEAITHGDYSHAQEELGDLLLAVTQTARHIGCDPELALRAANEKFIRRFNCMAQRVGGTQALTRLSQKEQLALWNSCK